MTSPLQRFISTKSLTKDESISNAPAVADRVIESIAGRARVLWELATGQNPVADSGYRLNPQGLRGVDLSGPPWGPALKHTICGGEWHIQGGGDIYSGGTPLYRITEENEPQVRKFVFEVRPFERRTNSPYSKLNVQLFAIADAGTPTIRVRTYIANRDGSIDAQKIICEETLNLNTTGVFSSFTSSAMYLPCSAGLNYVAVEVAWTTNGGAFTIDVHSVVVSQVVERGH